MQNFSPLSILVHDQARVYGNRTALRYRDYSVGIWKDISWNEFSSRVRELSNAMLSIGVEEQENMAGFSQNMPEVLMVDFAAYAIRAVTIPMYATSSEMQVKYIVSDASIRYIFVGEQEQYDIAFRVLKLGSSLEKLIIFDRNVQRNPEDNISIYLDDFRKGHDNRFEEEIERRTKAVQSQDLANILYTSGTTGLSKGVMLTHEMYNSALSAHYGVLPLSDKDIILNFLPFTHVLERGWSYLCIANGCTMAVNLRPADVLQSLREVHPTCMCAVPRFWEKVYAGVQERMEKSSPMQKLLLEDALRVGHAYNVDYKMKGITPPIGLRMQYSLYENTIIAFLKKQLGLERANFFPTAGAAVPTVIEDFVRSAGLNMVVGYGLTESTATVSIDRLGMPISIGSVGRLLDGVEIKFGENDEILLKGPAITKGYYKKEAATNAAFTKDGWFRTGDAGYLKDGFLFLTERIKDLFKTSNGKYIAPQAIETKMVVDRYIDQISIIADERKFVSALIVPDYGLVKKYAEEKGIKYETMEELLKHEAIMNLFRERIDTLQQQFAHYEQIKKFTLLPEPFSMAKGELTNTLKIKRSVLNKNYAAEIEKMYEE